MSSVQFNLLPDVKLDFIKAQRSKNLIFAIAVLVAAAAFVIFLIALVTVDGLQKKQLSNADNVVTTDTTKLNSMTSLDQIITVQNQLQTLTTLHQNKHITSRVFAYLPQLTPTDVSIGSLQLDTSTSALEVSGTAASQDSVNTFIDTLKFTNFTLGGQGTAQQAFTSVVESSFGIATTGVNYSLQISFNPELFSNNLSAVPQLVVPKLTTTRSALEDPSSLFNGQNGASTGGN
jgi:Tfp pilus assembly protein PilN